MRNKKWIVPVLCAVAVLYVQFMKIDRPYLGHFGSYQGTVMAEISRNMLRENFSQLLLPKTDALIVEPRRTLHLNQYPFPAVLAAAGVKFLGGSLEFWGRFQAILFNFLSALLLAGIAAVLWGSVAGLVAGTLFLIMPFSLIYGQMFFSEPQALFFLLLALWILLRQETGRSRVWEILLSAFCFSVAVTSRVHFVLFLPAYVYFAFQRARSLVLAGFYAMMALGLPVAWYGFTYFVLVSEPLRVHTTLFSQASASGGASAAKDLLAAGYWKHVLLIFAGRMLTPVVFPFALWGSIALLKARGHRIFFLLMFAGGLLPVFLLPQKVLDHEFYLYGFFPLAILAASFCLSRILNSGARFARSWSIGLFLLLLTALSLRLSIHPMFSVASGEERAVFAAKKAKDASHSSDIFIVGGRDAAAASYYLDRPSYGFPLNFPKVLPAYFTNRSFSTNQRAIVDAAEAAMQNDITYIEYLKSKGAAHILLFGRSAFDPKSNLISYLMARGSEISHATDDFYLFQL